MARYDKLSKALGLGLKEVGSFIKSNAQNILDEVDSAEKALALSPEQREVYLKALDEVYGPREQRIGQVLTDPKKVYHGTSTDAARQIDEFVPSESGYYGKGVYTTDNTNVANSYANGGEGSILPLYISGNLLDVRSSMKRNVPKELLEKARGMNEDAANQMIVRNSGGQFSGLTAPYKNYHLTTDPTQIRSTNAAFDPRFKDSAKILASVGGITLLGGVMSPEEANAAGPEAIVKAMKAAGKQITLTEAKAIKEAAKLITSPSEENIKAVKAVRDVYTRPDDFKRATLVGSGEDARVYESMYPGQVVKQFEGYGPAVEGIRQYPERLQFPASMLESKGLGPKSKTVRTSENVYQVQEKIKPLQQPTALINKHKDLKAKQQAIQKEYDAELDKIRDLPDEVKGKALDNLFAKNQVQEDELAKEVYKREYGVNYEDVVKKLDAQENPHWGSKDANPESLDAMITSYAQTNAMRSVPQLGVRDVHTGNVGINPITKEPQIFDTSRFGITSFRDVTPEQKELFEKGYIALPEEKKRFSKILDNPNRSLKPGDVPSQTPSQKLDLENDAMFQAYVEKVLAKNRGRAAAGAGTVLAAQALPDQAAAQGIVDEAPSRLTQSVLDAYASVRTPINQGLKQVSDRLSEEQALASGINPLTNPEAYKNLREKLGTGNELGVGIALDPLNAISGGAALPAAALDILSSSQTENSEPSIQQESKEDMEKNLPRWNSLNLK